jgi:uncharacterized protein YciI
MSLRAISCFFLSTLAVLAQPAPPATDRYFFGFLQSAPERRTLPKEEAARLQAAHLKHLGDMFQKGALVAAGPLLSGGTLRGVIIYHTATREQALEMAAADPAVQAGQLVPELHRWEGPAGIGERYRAEHQANPSLTDQMLKVQLVLLRRASGATAATPSFDAARRSGKLLAAGAILDDGELRGVLVLRAASADEARLVAALDPAVRESRLSADVHPWLVADGVLP